MADNPPLKNEKSIEGFWNTVFNVFDLIEINSLQRDSCAGRFDRFGLLSYDPYHTVVKTLSSKPANHNLYTGTSY